MSLLDMEPLDTKKMVLLFGSYSLLWVPIANTFLAIFKEEELWDLWLDFYYRTFMVWHNSGETPT